MTFKEFLDEAGRIILPLLGLLYVLKVIFDFGWTFSLGF